MHRDIRCVVRGDDDYPDALLELAQPPLVLFTKGRMHAFRRTVSIVGTRRMSAYGQEAARWIAETLAAGGIHIVSGLAEGIDAVAHRGALAVRGGTTAVLGCGVNLCYPSHHRRLYDEILASGGLIVSEYAPDVPVAKHRFPWRNRLIAALSPKLVLIQAGERSGALHTVDAALDLGRDVYVVPGPITASLHRGSNRLLQQGAQVLLDPTEFLADCGLDHAELSRSGIPERWRDLYDSMVEAKLPGQLARALGQPVGRVYEGLLELELAGMVARNPDGTYRRTGTATHGGRSVVDR
ncbi:DNA protecting protein DprA [Alicyclobacillus contaminans]|nr:DNA protecting protein DprA [Alicyclobacillus contaminans]